MSKRILVLEPDKEFATRLVQGLNKLGSFTVSVAPTIREALLSLTHERQDVAFLPVTEDVGSIRAMRTLQPNLRLIVTVPTTHYKVPEAYSGQIQGVLIKPLLDIDLSTVLEKASVQPVLVEESVTSPLSKKPGLDMAVVLAALQQAELGDLVRTAVFSRGARLVAHWGELNEAESAAVAWQVGQGWGDTMSQTHLQFMHLPARAGEILLYTRHVADDYLITMAAVPETPLSELRIRSHKLAAGLAEIVQGRLPVVSGQPVGQTTDELDLRQSYVIAWRPIRLLPEALHIPLRRAIERLATANACVLTYIEVRAELVHLVVLCPPGRDSAWAAYLFKNGSEQTIQQEYGVSTTLWDSGYYATESTVPLSEVELTLFLEA